MTDTRRLAAIMFTDIVGFTPLAHLDEVGALLLQQEQERLIRPLLQTYRGRKVKSTGDGLLVEFRDAYNAVQCAVELQRRVNERNSADVARPLQLRVGIHLGDVQRRGTDILGDAVNIAARVEPLAEPGGVCLSSVVYDQVHNKVPFQLEKLGPKSLKGVPEPMEVYRVVLPWAPAGSEAVALTVPRLAILPLTNISPDAKDDYFADGLTEELISVLSQIRGLRVIARTSVGQYKGTVKPIAQIGSELGVSAVLEGSVRKADGQLRISMQLIDVKTEEHRWSATYDRKLENVFAIQADVAERTAGALKIELLKSEREALQERPTSSLVAYESYLRGIRAFQQFGGYGSLAADQEAVNYFEDAIREDPQFSAAYSYLANHLIAVMGITRSGKEVFPRARELVVKALELNPNSSDTHTAQGNLAMQMDLDWRRAEAEFQQAISLNPSASVPHFWYGFLLGVLQRFDEAKQQYLMAIGLDPLWLLPKLNLLGTYEMSGDLESTIALGEKLNKNLSGNPMVRSALAWAYVLSDRMDDAVRVVGSLEGPSDLTSRILRSGFLAILGKPEEARALMKDYEEGRIPGYVPPVMAASFYAIWGEKEKALTLLERDFIEGDRTLWSFYQSELLDPLRDDPRFIAILKDMNLPTAIPAHRAKMPKRLKS
ncbi:MAG TPA: adenylate/guanylate cyclase domain-containing protein [Thermoplasmata archaeon]|nr:adenylate/guanylate cyclase domain-containing protein [Thermoplasmata archaeon]